MVVLPSFVQTADAQTYWDGEVIGWGYPDDPWGGWGGWGDDGWGCQSIGCESDDGGDDGGGDNGGNQCGGTNSTNNTNSYSSLGLPVYTKGGLIQSISGLGNFNNVNQCTLTPTQQGYCDKVSLLLNSSLAALPITGTAFSGYTIAQMSFVVANNTYGSAFKDIEYRFLIGMNIPQQQTGLIAWQELKIDWTQYSWNGSGDPTIENEGVYQIFAAFLHDLQLGNGVAGISRPDNDNSWSCPSN